MRTKMNQAALLGAAAVLLWMLPVAAQQSGDLSRKDLDGRLTALLLDTMNLGAATYNSGNQEGCYQLYLGTLRTMRTVLDHRPDLQKIIDDRISTAKGQKTTKERAFTLRDALDRCYFAITKDKGSGDGAIVAKKSLWDRLGGEGAVRAVVHDFMLDAAADAKVNFDRGGAYKLTPESVDLEQKVVELVSAVSGGPLKYTGKDMKAAHQGMGITDDEFNALAGHLIATLNKFKVPDAEQKELITIIASTRGDIVEGKKDDAKKIEDKKDDAKKIEDKKDDTKKIEDKKDDAKKIEDKKDDTKKIEDKKDDAKKIEDKKDDTKKIEEKKDADKKSLYDRLGGEKAVVAVVDDFVKRVAANPKVNFLRAGTPAAVKMDEAGVEKLKKSLVDLIGSVTGGPQKYTGQDMKDAHKGMGITDAEFDALAVDLKSTLDSFNVPEAEQQELLAIVGSTRPAIVEQKK